MRLESAQPFTLRVTIGEWVRFLLWCVVLVTSIPALAQESDQKFSVHKADGNSFGTYDTQEQAEAAIRTMPGPVNAEDAYQFVRYVKGSMLSEKGETVITYWLGRQEPLDPDWIYIWDPSLTSEEALIERIKADFNSDQCAGTQLAWRGEWVPVHPMWEGRIENREALVTDYEFSSNSSACEPRIVVVRPENSRPYGAYQEITPWQLSLGPGPVKFGARGGVSANIEGGFYTNFGGGN